MPKEKPQPLVAAKRAKVEGALVITDNGNAEMRRLYDERGVAKGEKAIVMLHRILVYRKNFLSPR